MGKRMTTKEKLRYSLDELLNIHSLEDITVYEICENAGLCVRTFYNHYHDKFELLSDLYHCDCEEKWHKDDRILTLSEFFDSCWKDPMRVKNAMDYHGQNNIREEIERKGVHDLIRLLQLNGYPYEIDDEIRNMLFFFMCGISHIVEYYCEADFDMLPIWLSKYGAMCLPEKVAKNLNPQ